MRNHPAFLNADTAIRLHSNVTATLQLRLCAESLFARCVDATVLAFTTLLKTPPPPSHPLTPAALGWKALWGDIYAPPCHISSLSSSQVFLKRCPLKRHPRWQNIPSLNSTIPKQRAMPARYPSRARNHCLLETYYRCPPRGYLRCTPPRYQWNFRANPRYYGEIPVPISRIKGHRCHAHTPTVPLFPLNNANPF